MAELRPFPGIRYPLERPEDAEPLVAPPYDVISPAQAEALRQRHPHNVIRLELSQDQPGDSDTENRYTRAAAQFRQWLSEGVLKQDEASTLYVYGQRYLVNGEERQRLGLLGALKVEPFEAKVVLPHEQTFPKHKEDRYRLLTTAGAQFSPIFGLYAAPDADVRAQLDAVAAGEPVLVATDPEGVEHRVWATPDPEFAAWASRLFEGKQVFIADGHHRYETALRHATEQRSATPDAPESAFDFVMTFLVEMDDPGLVLLPTHRLVRAALPAAEELKSKLQPYFSVEEVALEEADRLEHRQLSIALNGGPVWRLTLTDGEAVARLDAADAEPHSDAWRDLDVAILHRLVLQELLGITEHGEIVYTRDPAEARAAVTDPASGFTAAFVLPAPHVSELKAVAGAGDRMPEKSTYFWPKAITGLVIYAQ